MRTWKVDIPDGQQGAVKVAKFEIPKGSIEGLRLAMAGRGASPGWHTGLYRDGTLWMSDTSAEQRDHYEVAGQIRRRGGRILIMGLGLGMIVKQALECENVTHVDVVEIDPDVVALIGKHYSGPRCTIHVADAYTIKWPKGTRWTVAWHDIWPELCEDNLPEMGKLARSYGNRVDWQGFWAKETLLRHRRASGAYWR
jgi:hypothetical protein